MNLFLRERVGPFWARKYSKDSELMVMDIPLAVGESYTRDDSKMAATAVISTPVLDRDEDIVEQRGIMLDDYRTNPVVFFSHQQWPKPVGKSQDPDGVITVFPSDEKTIATCYFSQKDREAYQIYDLVAEEILRATSIAFNVLEAVPLEKGRYHLKKIKLTEWSWCGLGANQEALLVRLEKGLIRNEPIGAEFRKHLEPMVAELKARPVMAPTGGKVPPAVKQEPEVVRPVSHLGPIGKVFGAITATSSPWQKAQKVVKSVEVPPAVRRSAAQGLLWARKSKAKISPLVLLRGILLASEDRVPVNVAKGILKYEDAVASARVLPGWKSSINSIPDHGRILWNLWGGDPGLEWAKSLGKEAKEMDNMMDEAPVPPGQAVVEAIKQLLEAAVMAQEQPELTRWIKDTYHSLGEVCAAAYPDAGIEFTAIEKVEDDDGPGEQEEDESEEEEEDDESDPDEKGEDEEGPPASDSDEEEGNGDESDDDEEEDDESSKKIAALTETFEKLAKSINQAKGKVD